MNFNPRTPVGCDSDLVTLLPEPFQFQSTHPSGVRLTFQKLRFRHLAISIHAPQWGATCTAATNARSREKFQSTHPSGVRPYALRLRFVSRDFNPRTPVGCDPMSGCRFGRLRISIHAPQWGATATPSPSLSSFVISIHAPQWGATVPYGCVFGVVVISIHAPQWGATRAALEPWARVANFNPRTPVGCDCPAFVTMRRTLIFQSTHPSGVRRHHVGRRRRAGPISIHAPQWGATEAAEAFLFMPEIFQSTHPSGVRLDSNIAQKFASLSFQSTHPSGVRQPFLPRVKMHVEISIHAPQWGATNRRRAKRTVPKFQSTHPSGVRPAERASLRRRTDFNPRTPVGCDRSRRWMR